jgi:hypothetical protein
VRQRRGHGGLSFGLVIAVVLIAIIAIFRSGPRSTTLREAAEPAIQAIEQYAQEHDGRYPATLAVTGASPALTAYGRYHYQVLDDGANCSLSVGSEARDGFMLRWDCRTRLWTMNPRSHIEPAAPIPAALSRPAPDSEPPHDSSPLV